MIVVATIIDDNGIHTRGIVGGVGDHALLLMAWHYLRLITEHEHKDKLPSIERIEASFKELDDIIKTRKPLCNDCLTETHVEKES